MRNGKPRKIVKASRDFVINNLAFRMGYEDVYWNRPWSSVYDRMDQNQQVQYEQGRLMATALKSHGVAPHWNPKVQCPRDLPRLMREYGHQVIPIRQRVSA